MSEPTANIQAPQSGVTLVRDKTPRRRMQRPKALPLRTWLLVLMVLVSGLGLAMSSLAVSSIMRNVLYTRVDTELNDAHSSWASNLDESFYMPQDGSRRPPTDYVALAYYPDGSVVTTRPIAALPDARNVIVGGEPTTVRSIQGETEWRAVAKLQRDGSVVVVAKDMTTENSILKGLAIVQVIIAALVLSLIHI